MVYAQFFHDSTGWNGKDFAGPVTLIEMCGSDGVFHLDARKSLHNQKLDASQRMNDLNRSLKKGIRGFRIMRGMNYSSAKPISEIQTPA
jgi:hypothetical protein